MVPLKIGLAAVPARRAVLVTVGTKILLFLVSRLDKRLMKLLPKKMMTFEAVSGGM